MVYLYKGHIKTYGEEGHVKMETKCDISYRPRTTDNLQKLEEKHGTDSPSEAPEGTNLANTLL